MIMRWIHSILTLIQAGDHIRHMGRREYLASDRSYASSRVEDGEVPHETQDDRVAHTLNDYLAMPGFNQDGHGIYIGDVSQCPIFFESNQPSILFYGNSQTGKFTTSIAYQLANLVNNSVIGLDPKGEFYLRTASHRAKYQVGKIFALCADRNLGIPTVGFNPLSYLGRLVDAGENIDSDAREIVEAIFSTAAKVKDKRSDQEHWTVSQAKDFFFIFIVAMAYLDRRVMTLGGLYDFAHETDDEFWNLIALFSRHPAVSETCQKLALALIDEFVTAVRRKKEKATLKPRPEAENSPGEAAKQTSDKEDIYAVDEDGNQIWDWEFKHDKAKQYLSNIRERMRAAIRAYSPDSPFRSITDETNFDVSILAEQPSTLFIVLPERYPKIGAKWATLMFDALFREMGLLNSTKTRPVWIMDELTTLPPIPDYMDRLNRMASKGHRFLSYAHSPKRYDAVYGDGAAEALEECSVMTIGWHVSSDRIVSKVADFAGERTVSYVDYSVSDNVDADGSTASKQTTKLPNATKAQVAGIAHGREWILLDGYPAVGVMDRRPFYDNPQYAAVIGPRIEELPQAAE